MMQSSGQQGATGGATGGAAAGRGVSIQPREGGGREITVPDGRGGTSRIVIGVEGITIDGEQVVGTATAPVIAPPPPLPARTTGNRRDIPDGVIAIVAITCSMIVAVSLGGPLVRSFTRWIDRRTAGPQVPNDVAQRLAAIEQAVELVAVEVERISEGQRFTAKLLADRVADRAAERAPVSPERSPHMEPVR